MRTFAFLALGSAVRVEADEHLAGEGLGDLLCTYAPSSAAPTVRYRLASGQLWRDGGLLAEVEQPLDLVPLFEVDLYRTLLARRGQGWPLHAACLSDGERALVLTGASGNGKSTLSMALAGRGLRYLADDLALVMPDGRAAGISRPISFPLPPQRVPERFRSGGYPLRIGGRLRRQWLVQPPEERMERGAPRVALLVQLSYRPDQPRRCRRLSPGEALLAAWPGTLGGGKDAWPIAVRLVGRVPVFALSTRRVEEAADDLQRLLEEADRVA